MKKHWKKITSLFLILGILAFFNPYTADAAFAIDNRSNTGAVGTSPVTTAVTVNEVSPLIVTVLWQGSQTVTSVVYNTTETLTLIATKKDSLSLQTLSVYGLKNPSTGTHNVVTTFSANPSSGAIVFYITTTGGDTTTGWRTASTRNDADGTGPGMTLANSQNGDIVIHPAQVFATTITWDAGETTTSTTANNPGGSGFSGGMSTKAAVGANTVVGATDVATYSEIAFALISGASAATTNSATMQVTGQVFIDGGQLNI